MESELLQQLGIGGTTGFLILLVIFLIKWLREMVMDLQKKYDDNTKVTAENSQVIKSLQQTQEKLMDKLDNDLVTRVNDYLRSSNNDK